MLFKRSVLAILAPVKESSIGRSSCGSLQLRHLILLGERLALIRWFFVPGETEYSGDTENSLGEGTEGGAN